MEWLTRERESKKFMVVCNNYATSTMLVLYIVSINNFIVFLNYKCFSTIIPFPFLFFLYYHVIRAFFCPTACLLYSSLFSAFLKHSTEVVAWLLTFSIKFLHLYS